MNKTLIEMKCPFCRREHSVTVNTDAYNDWLNGDLIQRAMPELSATEREQLISQMCPNCLKSAYGE